MNYLFIQNCRSDFPVVRMCQNLDVSESGYYEWLTRSKSSRKIAKEKLMTKISELFYLKHKQMAGSPLITEDLHDDPDIKLSIEAV